MFLDVDHFKSFNDRYGHLHGDKVLEYFASSARLNLESVDYAGFRFGGDEFLIVLPGRAADATQFLADRLQKNIRHRSFLLKGSRFRMSFSAGIASFPRDGKSTDELLANADKALYFAKRSGRRRSKQFRRIGFEDAWRRLRAGAIFTVLALLLLFARDAFFSGLKRGVEQLKEARMWIMMPPAERERAARSEKNMRNAVIFYLKTGDVLKGHIVNETRDGIFVDLDLGDGEATIFLQRNEIDRVEIPKKEKFTFFKK